MAPEQLVAHYGGVGPWTDLYALGCVAWELFCGAPPYNAPTVDEITHGHLYLPVPEPPPGTAGPELSRWLRRSLAKNPRERYRRAADALAALSAIADVDLQKWTPAPIPRRSSGAVTYDLGAFDDAIAGPEDGVSAPVAVPAMPDRWPVSRPAALPRHGAELALVGLRRPPMFGREIEREALWSALAAVRTDRRARVVAVIGEAGVGRTRLLEAFGEVASASGAAEVCWRTARRKDELPSPVEETSAADRPLLVVIDDADRDPEGWALASRVARGRRIEALPILVVVSVGAAMLRADPALAEELAERIRTGGGSEIVLQPLPPEVVDALLHHLLRVDGPSGQALIAASAGNPGFLVATVAAWVAAGAVVAAGDRYGLVGEPSVPASLERVGADALAGLADADLRAIEVASVLSPPFDTAAWAEVAGHIGVPVAADLVDRARRGGVLTGEFDRLSFATPMVRAAAEASARRAGRWPGLHLAAAAALGGRVDELAIGWHLVAAGDDRGALQPLLGATLGTIDRLREQYAALRHRAAALDRLGEPADGRAWAEQHDAEARIHIARGEVALAAAAIDRAWTAATALDEPALLARVASQRVQIEQMNNRSGLAAAEIALEASRRASNGAPAAPARNRWIHALLDSGRVDEALAEARRWLTELPADAMRRPMVLRTCAVACVLGGDFGAAHAYNDESAAIDRVAGRAAGMAFASSMRAEILNEERRPKDAIVAAAQAQEAHRRVGNLYGVRNGLLIHAMAEARFGDPHAALERADEAEAFARALQALDDDARLPRIVAMLALGDRDAARRLLAELSGTSHPDGRVTAILSGGALMVEATASDAFACSAAVDAVEGPIVRISATSTVAIDALDRAAAWVPNTSLAARIRGLSDLLRARVAVRAC